MNIYHKHHIVPRHMGGTDDPSNLIELTVEEHAEAHRKLYEQFGKEEDRIAYLGLFGQASKPELMRLASKLGRAKTDKVLEEKYGTDWRSIHAKNSSAKAVEKYKQLYKNDINFKKKILNAQKKAVSAALTVESREKRKTTFAKIGHQQGKKNSNYGKMWTSNVELQISKMHPKNIQIPDGWIKGRRFGSG